MTDANDLPILLNRVTNTIRGEGDGNHITDLEKKVSAQEEQVRKLEDALHMLERALVDVQDAQEERTQDLVEFEKQFLDLA